MRHHALSLPVCLLLLIPAAWSADLVEAEATGVGRQIVDAACFGGAAITADAAWQPLLHMPPPPTDLKQVALWVRHRHGPLQPKALRGDGQVELAWHWASPDTWTWSRLGSWPRAEVAEGVVVIRGNANATQAPAIDVACWTSPQTAAPEDPAAIPRVALSVAWNEHIGSAGPLAYGINVFRGFDPSVTAKPAYQDGIRRLGCGLIRFHSAELLSGRGPNTWIDVETANWIPARIHAALQEFPRDDRLLMLNISNWPAHFDADGDGFIDADRFDDYATFCADLVRIVNIDGGFAVPWWEITNELDDRYHNHLVRAGKPSRMTELCDLWNRAAIAMKAVDPQIKTGGPALIRPDLTDSLRLFIRGTREHLDFVTYHAYASGSADDADERIFTMRVDAIADAVRAIATLIPEEAGRPLPHVLDEFNISWTWETRDPRMTNHKGAVFDALIMAAVTTAGADGTCAWNEYDGVYGKFNPALEARPQVGLYHHLNRWGYGDLVRTTVLPGGPVVAYAVQGETGRLLMVINRANYQVLLNGWPAEAATAVWRVDEHGSHSAVDQTQPLPRHSVTLLHWQ